MEVSEISFLRSGIIEPDVFVVEGKGFLEKMRHTSCFNIVREIKSFINNFTTMEGQPDDFSSYLLGFLEDMLLIIQDHSQWKDEDEKGIIISVEALERYLLTRLYSTAFYIPSSTDSEDDEKFYHRVRILQFLQPDHLDLPKRKYNQIAFEMAAQELSRLEEDLLKSPREKLACIINAVTIVMNLLRHSSSVDGTGADDFLPYVIYLLLLTSPKHIHSNLRYIRRFRRPTSLTSEEAYYLTQVESGVMFITNLDHTSLSITEEQFLKGISEAKDKIQNGLDVPKRFSKDNGWERLLVDLAATNLTFNDTSVPSSDTDEEDKERKPGQLHLPSVNDTVGFPQSEDMMEEDEDEDNTGIVREHKVMDHQSMNISQLNIVSTTIRDCINKRLLHSRFEDMTITDLKQLHISYQTIATRLEDLKQRLS